MAANEMERFVHELREQYGSSQHEDGRWYLNLRFRQCGDLQVEEVRKDLVVKVTFFLSTYSGSKIADPEIHFFVGEELWEPFQMDRYCWRVCCGEVNDAGKLQVSDPNKQGELAEYADILAVHWRLNGWVLQAQPYHPFEEDEIPF